MVASQVVEERFLVVELVVLVALAEVRLEPQEQELHHPFKEIMVVRLMLVTQQVVVAARALLEQVEVVRVMLALAVLEPK